MKRMKYKKVILTSTLFATLLLIAYGTSTIKADDVSNYPPIVQTLVDKFGLNADEVDEVLSEAMAERHAQMQQNKEDALNQAVTDGVITEEQKEALIEKHQEMWQERKTEREQHKEEMEAWFEEQGIDHDTLREYMGGFGKRGGFKGFGKRLHQD
jgi:hypothetical protein